MQIRIRDAHDEDWAAIWPFFRAITAAGETYTYPRDIDSGTGRALWMPGPPGHTVVAVAEDGTVLGSAKTGPNQMGPGAHIATAGFMVSPAAAGRGVGRALGEYVLARAKAEGYRAMQFNAVVQSNVRAVALWKSLGFEVVGTVPEAYRLPDGSFTGLHVMHRVL
ncbi:GNAT family N-acetyltransferase [Streptomyces morookaense]|uniref:GNAT family N-acetyltransferase n=1 Tax=Streptomyces TaxID=1883 RepID=UPI001D103773|nr:GNAT family N-acetyltransferase [Streptomyces sp. ET3-23]MCC2278667.1 GNAT family N-acetyltransferase [Streptomyces sp. ET3-23]